MDFLAAVERVESSDGYAPDDGYLVHGFVTRDGEAWTDWQIGFYNKERDTITPYSVNDSVVRGEPAEVFKDGGHVLPLIKGQVIIKHSDATEKAELILRENHPGHSPTKIILLLQHLSRGHVYNVTVVTDTLHMLNVKLDSETGKVLETSFDSILALRKD